MSTVSVRKVVRGFGKTSISAGVLILLFVAYQLWGTGIAEARSQDRLKKEFATPTTLPASSGPTTTTIAGAPDTIPVPVPGSAIAIIRIPKIGVSSAVVEGIGVDDLKHGPGHYPSSVLPGQRGNAAIAGHRTTYGAPFYRLDELKAGDHILVTTRDSAQPFDYQVTSSTSVDPSDVAVLDPTADNRLTLTTCTPRFTASQRLVVVATLVGTVDPRPVATPAQGPSTPTLPGDSPAAKAGLSGKGTSTLPGIAWGAACAAIWILAWAFGQLWHRRMLVYAVATPIFLVCLFVFFENTARFVPANI